MKHSKKSINKNSMRTVTRSYQALLLPVVTLIFFLSTSAVFALDTNGKETEEQSNNFFFDKSLKDAAVLEAGLSENDKTFHLFSHGKSGELLLNGKWLNAEQLVHWFTTNEFLENATYLNIYGCEFAKGEKGLAAVVYLENELNITISASTNVTGKDGDWVLEIGGISIEEFQTYQGNLQCSGPVGDCDGDGEPDVTDLDDDNDGILDANEQPSILASTPFSIASGASQTITVGPIADQVFLDIISLDNNFSLELNGIMLFNSTNGFGLTDDFTFQSSGPFVKDIRFQDGDEYGINVLQIFQLSGNVTNPLVRFIINSNGTIDMFGSKVSGGPLFPLELYNGAAFNPVNWLFGANNIVTLGQAVQGPTNCTGSFYGLTAFDTDKDGFVDSIDLDSDNDGCPDVVESGGLDGNGDGILDDGTSVPPAIVVNGDGVITNGTGGYDNANGTEIVSDVISSIAFTPNPTEADANGDITLTAIPTGERVIDFGLTGATTDDITISIPIADYTYRWYAIAAPAVTLSTANTLAITGLTSSETYAVEVGSLNNGFDAGPDPRPAPYCGIEASVLALFNPCTIGASTDGTPTASDSDGDGINDICDLDDDNDGILDVTEYDLSGNINILPSDLGLVSNSTGNSGSVDISTTLGLPIGTTILNFSNVRLSGTVFNVQPTDAPAPSFSLTSSYPVVMHSQMGRSLNSTGDTRGIEINDGTTYSFESTLNTGYVHNFEPAESYEVERLASATVNQSVTQNRITWVSDYPNTTFSLDFVATGSGSNYFLRVQLPADTDSDGIPNYLDPDSDNDGCNDVHEAGYTDAGFDGVLGDAPVVVNSDGLVVGTNVVDGYTGTTPEVTDSVAIGGTICAVILPVELVNFQAVAQDNRRVALTWQTVSEKENDYFDIYKSTDLESWEYVTSVDGAGNSSELLEYSANDLTPFSGASYYKLMQVDFNGTVNFGGIRSVEIDTESNGGLSIYPNPTAGKLKISGAKDQLQKLQLFNSIGQQVNMNILVEGNSSVTIDISNLDSGVYLIQSEDKTYRIIKN